MRYYYPTHTQAHEKSGKLKDLRITTISLLQEVIPLPDQVTFAPEDKKLEVAENCLVYIRQRALSLGIEALFETSFLLDRANVDETKLTIALKDKEFELQNGDRLLVVDTGDLRFMGTFKVIERRGEQCYASSGRDIDKLWLGHIMAHGEMTMLPNKIAIPANLGENHE